MMKNVFCLTGLLLLMQTIPALSQTAYSLFSKADSVQVTEIVSENADMYKKVGHHGPAVENSHYALRLYFNDSGAIDVYSKCGRGMELRHYKWYPSAEAQSQGAGCDEYYVGKTLGLGGFALRDGDTLVHLAATKGRTARVGETKKGAFAELVSYGVPYGKDTVDVSVRIDMDSKGRVSVITAKELSGKKVQFMTGINYHDGQTVKCGDGFMYAWGPHPADVSQNPVAIGAGMFFNTSDYSPIEVLDDMLVIYTAGPVSEAVVKVVAASSKEAEINNAKRLESFMSK